jgi:hypothetical protein
LGWIVAAAAASFAADSARSDAPAPLAPAPILERLGRAALDLAKRGRHLESAETADVLAELHAPAADVTALKESITKTLAKSKPAPLPIPDAAKSLAKIAADLAATLPSLVGDARTAAARQALRLDGACRGAHEALGHVECNGAWIPAGLVSVVERRAKIQAAVQDARKLDVPIDVGESWMPILENVYGKKGIAARCGDVSVHSATHSGDQLTRQLRQALRAVALSNCLVNGEVALPALRGATTPAVFVGSMDAYKKAAGCAKSAGDLSAAAYARAMKMSGFYAQGYSLDDGIAETSIGANCYFKIVHDLTLDARPLSYMQPALLAGHMNWVYSGFLGVPMPAVAWTEKPEDKKGVTSDTPQSLAEREEMLRLAKAGLSGSRMYMRWLVRRGEDPAWSKSMVDEIGKIQGNDLMKSTLVVEYLQETKDFTSLLRDTCGDKPCAESFEKALGVPLPEFEARWREWLFAGEPASGLVQRLGARPVEPVSPADKAVLDYLNMVRKKTLGKDAPNVGVDRELSDGCRAHALYLGLHPKQMSEWPAAHEEYADQEGFSAAGCRAGLSSVIVGPGIDNPAEAVDGWMATFYHRLPLLDPGLVRIGWALEKGVAVLDSGSLVAPVDATRYVTWPHADARDVPRRFPGELPNPVPGADQSQWGYPVTIQFFNFEPQPDVQMRLYVGKRGGVEIACHYSTPQKPTNTDLAPAGAFCLIPKTPLLANTTYAVAVDGWPRDAGGADWTFTTGAK